MTLAYADAHGALVKMRRRAGARWLRGADDEPHRRTFAFAFAFAFWPGLVGLRLVTS